MNLKKILFLVSVLGIVFCSYTFLRDNRINYVCLGDSLAAGQNPYGEIGYGYTDYLKDYLATNNKLRKYSDYAISGYKTTDVISDIAINRELENDNIREDLRESDLVTLSIGANDFLESFSISDLNFNDVELYIKKIDDIIIKLDKTLKVIREYAKQQVILIGYYNPFPILYNITPQNIDKIFNYADSKYSEIASKYNIDYLSIYEAFKEDSSFLPNPFDIHPDINGYKKISDLLIETYFD